MFIQGDLALLVILGSAIIGGLIGMLRGHNIVVAMAISALLAWLVFPIVGWILLLLVPGKKRCPKCRERIERKAVVCRFCGYSYAPAPAPTPA